MEECLWWRAVATAVWHIAVLIPSVRATPLPLTAVRIVWGQRGTPDERMRRATHDALEREALTLVEPRQLVRLPPARSRSLWRCGAAGPMSLPASSEAMFGGGYGEPTTRGPTCRAAKLRTIVQGRTVHTARLVGPAPSKG
jgi:hypothetical protein